MRDPRSVGKCKALINSLIKQKSADPHETSIQKKLIDFKRSTSHFTGDDEIDGQIGRGYWAKFLKRNIHLIQTKKGEKFELNRSLWTTFAKMLKIYDRTSKELVDEAKGAVELDDPMWMNEKGEEVEEKDAVGCKVTIDITQPEYCIVADEVGGDTCQLDDGHVGRERMVCEAQTIANSKAQHFTVLGLTLLTGEPLLLWMVLLMPPMELRRLLFLFLPSMKPDILLESDSFCSGEAIILSNVSVYSACSRDESLSDDELTASFTSSL